MSDSPDRPRPAVRAGAARRSCRTRWRTRSSTTPCRSSCRGPCPTCATASSRCTAGSSGTWSEQGFRPDRPFVKCARVTGDTMAALPPARRLGHLRRPRAHGPAVLAAPPADRLPRQLRQPRLRSGRRALHRVPAAPAGDAAARRHRRGHRRHGAQLRRLAPSSRRCCRRGSRTCSSTAARASPSAWPRTSRRTTSAR